MFHKGWDDNTMLVSPNCHNVLHETQAMQLMSEGAKWELYIPSELAYGDRGAGALIKPGDVLIFDLEMIEVLGTGGSQ